MSDKCAEEDIQVERLIILVGQKPAIWDRYCPDHQSRSAIAEAWKSVAQDMKPGFEQLSPAKKNAYVKFLMKKWRNIRDQYAKSVKKANDQRKLGVPEKSIRRYIYESELHFLNKHETFYSFETGNSGDGIYDDGDGSNADFGSICSVELHQTEEDHQLSEPSRKRQCADQLYPRTVQEDDPKLLFFKSLLPSVEDFTVDEMLQMQSGIISVIQDIKRSRLGQPQYISPSSYMNSAQFNVFGSGHRRKRPCIEYSQSPDQSEASHVLKAESEKTN